MRIKPKYRVLLVVLALCVLASGVGVVVYHGEWWYPLVWRMRHDAAPALSETALSGETLHLTLDELLAREDVTFSYSLLLVNASHPLPEGYVPELIEYNGAKMHPLMQEPYIALRDDVQAKTGVRIYVASDYRTPEEQADLLASSDAGIAAGVGCSEHEAGLALDVYAPYFGGKSFLRSRAGREVNDTCGKYGFIIRYPSGKEDITGIAYEPWHIRYVGAPHASVIMDSGLTLEEYISLYTPNVWYTSGEYLISRRSADALDLPAGWLTCNVSPDNTGYWFVTVKTGG